MDSMKSFKGYGKVDELEEQAFRRKARKRCIILTVSTIVLLAVIVGAVAGVLIHRRSTSSSSSSPNTAPVTPLTPAASLKAVCGVTQYPTSCVSSISSLETSNTSDPEVIFKLSLHVAINAASKLTGFPAKFRAKLGKNDAALNKTLTICEGLFEDVVDRLNDSLTSMDVKSDGDKLLSAAKIDDMKTWLSTTLTDQETCLDALQDINSTHVVEFKEAIENTTEFASNSLAIVTKIIFLLSNLNVPVHRRLLGVKGSEMGFPGWVGSGDRRLLQDNDLGPNITVAKDGTGDFKTIGDAVAAIPAKSNVRFVIHVKQGVYNENVLIDKTKWNVMIYGDGKTKTTVNGSLNFVDGTPTFSTATFGVAGKGFIAKDMGFVNSAGPEKHQAVAFRSGSDMSVYYRCSFDGYQDTLYPHSNRQFYRECDITGTIDFIFGNAGVVFQECNIMPRQPMANQFNTITAQGKKDPNQNTGISIQKCNVSPLDSNLTAQTYLGRPWKEYSTTVFMQSSIGSFLNPLGWIGWVSNVEPPSTIFYAEYQNSGQGSSVGQRVNWAGYRPSLTDDEASKFTVESLIQGSEWLPAANVAFDKSL